MLRMMEKSHRVLRSITTAYLKPLHKLQGWDFIDAWFQCAEGKCVFQRVFTSSVCPRQSACASLPRMRAVLVWPGCALC